MYAPKLFSDQALPDQPGPAGGPGGAYRVHHRWVLGGVRCPGRQKNGKKRDDREGVEREEMDGGGDCAVLNFS